MIDKKLESFLWILAASLIAAYFLGYGVALLKGFY